MNYLVAFLPDAYLREMAEYYAKQRPPFDAQDAAPADAAMLARGKAIATAGDASKAIPACVACHGASLPAWSRASRAWSACALRTSRRNSRAGASAAGTPRSPTA